MSCERNSAGKLFHTTGLLIEKRGSPYEVFVHGIEHGPDPVNLRSSLYCLAVHFRLPVVKVN